ncbi:MAG TPA: 3-isopropylmalate dehydratase small subunit [Planctomycetota bacterium]|nr:3-isopropylmalate dehydratase small subunit [Planctomycetota bacterium]
MKGKVHKFGDDVNTDEIIPARYLNTSDPAELAAHCMEDADPEFVKKLKPGDIIVGGRNFGCGSSREHAPVAIKTAGISCVIARSFARIFFRNAINIGLAIIVCPEAVDDAETGDEIAVSLDEGVVANLTRKKTYAVPPFPEEMRRIIDAGGLMAFVRQSTASKG